MKLRKQHVLLILAAAVLLGFIGAYFGNVLAESNESTDHNEMKETSNSTSPPNMEKINRTYHLIKEQYLKDVDDKKLTEGAIKGMVTALDDPFSSYMDAESMKKFNQTIESSFEGIGAEVSMINDKVTIVSPIKDSPAEDAGLRPNDQILSVDGESVSDLSLNEAVNEIRGEKGTEVAIEIKRSGVSDPFVVDVVRDEIPVDTVYSDLKKVDGKKTGIIEISSFAEETAEEFNNHLDKLENKGIEGLVIDVRGNPGGVLTAVEGVLENFIPQDKPYVQIESKNGNKDKSFSSLDEKKPYPINVLSDEGSASASEILAVAMKETGYDVVGTTSFGKGTVQQAKRVGEDGSRVKLSMFKWLSPDGNWIHEEGVEPTVEVEQPDYYSANPALLKDGSLSYNEASEEIENLQVMLKGLDYEPGRTDGYFNEDTQTSVEKFQNNHDLDVTGKVNEKTAESIETAIMDRIRDGQDDQQMDKALDVLYK